MKIGFAYAEILAMPAGEARQYVNDYISTMKEKPKRSGIVEEKEYKVKRG